MKLDDLRSLRDAQPFRPFMLKLDDGREFFIEAPSYLGITPKGVLLAVSRRTTAWFVPEKVTEARPLRLAAG